MTLYQVVYFDGRYRDSWPTLDKAQEQAVHLHQAWLAGHYGHNPAPRIYRVEPIPFDLTGSD
jgi:hypothetical protein